MNNVFEKEVTVKKLFVKKFLKVRVKLNFSLSIYMKILVVRIWSSAMQT
jgi:hypothetical protein